VRRHRENGDQRDGLSVGVSRESGIPKRGWFTSGNERTGIRYLEEASSSRRVVERTRTHPHAHGRALSGLHALDDGPLKFTSDSLARYACERARTKSSLSLAPSLSLSLSLAA